MAGDVHVGSQLDVSPAIRRFAHKNAEYYVDQFTQIEQSSDRVWSFNVAAAVVGPLWAAARGVWGFFWLLVVIELMALVQLGRGLWGDLGASFMMEADSIKAKSATFFEKADTARQAGDTVLAASHQDSAENLVRAAEDLIAQAEQAMSGGTMLLLTGLVILIGSRIGAGYFANQTYERQFTRWRTDVLIPSGMRLANLAYGSFLLVIMYPLTLYRFTASRPDERIVTVPIGREYFSQSATAIENWFDRTAAAGEGVFDGITATVRAGLELFELSLIGTPWPVVMIFFFIVAWRLASMRVAIFCVAGLAYFGFLGFWETAMVTFAQIATAASFCIAMGIPLGIWFSKSDRAYAIARPVLDLMQTLPPFVYLIPIIAFFGTGRVPGVLATIIVGMPPVIRLTALGVKHVDQHVKEAARAFGASKTQVLTGVELPLAVRSIMTGVNQTILLCLAMVVIASMIGAKGLGQNVLLSLQLVTKGQGLLAGLAILFCAMILDRMVQGRFQREDSGQ